MARPRKAENGEAQTEKVIVNVTATLKENFLLLCELQAENPNTILTALMTAAVETCKPQIENLRVAKIEYQRKLEETRLKPKDSPDYSEIVARAVRDRGD